MTTAAPPGAAVERLGRAGGLAVAGAAVSAVSGLALTVVLTRSLPPGEVGLVVTATALFVMATTVAQAGTDVGLARTLPGLLAAGRPDRARPVLRSALGVVAAASLVLGAGAWCAAVPLARLVTDGDPAALAGMLRVLAVLLPAAALFATALAATRGLRTQVPTVVLDALGRSVGQTAAVAAAVLAGAGAGGVVLAWGLPYAVGLVAAGVWLAVLLRRRRSAAPAATGDDDDAVVAGFWRFTAPRAVATLSQVLLKRLDIVLVTALRGPGEAAVYAAATRFVAVGQVGVQALQQAMAPQLAGLFAAGDLDGVRAVHRTATTWSMLLAWPAYCTVAVLSPWLLEVFGDGYPQAAPVVVVLSGAMLLATASGAVDTVLLMSGRTWASLGNTTAALAVDVVLLVALVPGLGALGAGLAWAAAIAVRNLLPLWQVRSGHGVTPLSRGGLLVAVASLACFALPGLLVLAGAGLPLVLATLGLGAAAYAVVVHRAGRLLALDVLAGVLRTALRPAARRGAA